jgi:twinkle protein
LLLLTYRGLFGLDTVPDNATEIIITEGEYDAMAAYQALKIPSISLPNGATNLPTQTLPYFERFEKIYLWMDADQAGQISALNFARKLGEKKTFLINARRNDPTGPKDANDALILGKNFKDYIEQAKPLSDDNIIKVSDLRHQVVQFLLNYNEFSGYKSMSFTFFNKKLKGLRMGEFTILTGETGSGKTTFLTQLSLDFLMQRVPTLWGSFEIKNDKLASLFLMQFAKKDLRHCKVEDIEYYSENFEKLPLYLLKFHGSQNIDEVIATMNYAIYNYDIQHIVLDNLQFMIGIPTKFVNKFDLQDEIIHKLRKFATEKNVHITLVIHPRKTDEALNIASIFGSGKASQEADNIFILQSLKGLRVIEVAKNRFDGSVGKVVVGFDHHTCRFFELTEEEFMLINQNKSKLDNIVEERIKRYGSLEIKIHDDTINANKLIEIPGREFAGSKQGKIIPDNADFDFLTKNDEADMDGVM